MRRTTATLFSLIALAAVPTVAHAQPVGGGDDSAGPGGCHVTDQDGYDIPVHNGEGVIVQGKTYTCTNGTVTVSVKSSGGRGHVNGHAPVQTVKTAQAARR